MSTRPSIKKVSDEEWAGRRAGNLRLAWFMVGLALVLFLIAIWKYRPL